MKKEKLIEQINKVKEAIKEKENDCDGTVELLEDHLSDLMEDLQEEIYKVNESIDEAEIEGDESYIEELYDIRSELLTLIED